MLMKFMCKFDVDEVYVYVSCWWNVCVFFGVDEIYV